MENHSCLGRARKTALDGQMMKEAVTWHRPAPALEPGSAVLAGAVWLSAISSQEINTVDYL